MPLIGLDIKVSDCQSIQLGVKVAGKDVGNISKYLDDSGQV